MKPAPILLLLLTALCLVPPCHAAIPALPDIPAALPAEIREPLIAKHTTLVLKRQGLIEEGEANTRQCSNIKVGSAEHQTCLSLLSRFNARVEALRRERDRLEDEIDAAVSAEEARVNKGRIIQAMKDLAKRLGWSADEQARLEKALNRLDVDGAAATGAQINEAWKEVLTRGNDEGFAREASQGNGPGFPGAGQQTRYQDCAIFALANAAGLPYGVVATRAAELIRQGEWRGATDRANPQGAIEQSGLNGGEVVMLAEAFGRAEVVPGTGFAKTLKEGRRVLVNVVPQGGRGGHEVVLTKVFQRGGENWYEMMDSNQGRQRRLYLNHKELGTILQENGVAFRPDPGKTPMLLR